MESFRRNIIGVATALVIMVVSIPSGMFEYILSAQTAPTMNLEEVLHHSTTVYSDTENETNDECCPRRVKKYSSKTTHSPHFANLSYSVRRLTEHIVTPITSSIKTSRPLSTLFCTFRI